VDALGEPLITNSTPGVSDVDWIFDPGCFVDDDGQAYLYFGGGPEDTGDNARVIRLNDDMVSLMDSSATTIPAPLFFEASFMHKREGTYYYSYSTNFLEHAAYLDYMTSDDPMTGFVHRGSMLTSGTVNANDNNHGSVVDFAGKTYIFYHNRKAQQEAGGSNNYQRSAAIQELSYETDGTITELAMSTADTTVAQLKCLDGYAEVEAERMAAQSGIEVEGDGEVGVSIVSIDPGDWIGYSQVDFRTGATKLVARVASAAGGPSIEVRIDGCDDAATGPHDLCLAFSGTGTVELDSFHLE
jgi:arabinoxylan arabinofuranohydrolase